MADKLIFDTIGRGGVRVPSDILDRIVMGNVMASEQGIRERKLELMRSIRKTTPPPTQWHERKDRPRRQVEKQRLRMEYWE